MLPARSCLVRANFLTFFRRVAAVSTRMVARPRGTCPFFEAYWPSDPRDDDPVRQAPQPDGHGRRRAGDIRQYRPEAEREENSQALQRFHPRRLCRLSRRLVRAVLAFRGETRTISRQPRTLSRGARSGLAQRSAAPSPRG